MATRWLSIACDWNIIFKMKFFYLLWLLHIYVSDGLRISCGTRGAGTNIVFPDTDLRELRCVCSDPNSGDILEKYWLILIPNDINLIISPNPIHFAVFITYFTTRILKRHSQTYVMTKCDSEPLSALITFRLPSFIN